MDACTSSHKPRIWCQPTSTRHPRATFRTCPDQKETVEMRARIHRTTPTTWRRLQLLILLAPILALAACGGNSGAGWGPGSTLGNTSTNHIVQQGGLIIFAPPTLQQALPALTDAFLKARHISIPYAFNFSGDEVNANTANTLADTDLMIADNQQTLL